jgi:hypothetical protein
MSYILAIYELQGVHLIEQPENRKEKTEDRQWGCFS